MILTSEFRHRSAQSWEKLLPFLSASQVRACAFAVGEWFEEACRATGNAGKCYRSALYQEGELVGWSHPNSNTTELITAWLDLSEMAETPLSRQRYLENAIRYAHQLASDPIHGFYRGEEVSAHGLAWYWTDDGTYTGGYSMRALGPLLRLNALAPDSRLIDAALSIGNTFLGRQLPNGFASVVGWCPRRGWLSERNAGSRYLYSVAVFAHLYRFTGDSCWKDAYERSVQAIEATQREDGAFYQHYDPVTLEPTDQSVKAHFFSYLLNAFSEAYPVFEDERLLTVSRRLGDFIVRTYAARHQLPYCLDPVYKADLAGAGSAVTDSAAGMLWLGAATGDARYRDVGAKLWLEGYLHQPHAPEAPGWHGAIPIGDKRCDLWYATAQVMASRRLLDLI